MKTFLWSFWSLITLIIVAYFTYTIVYGEDKTQLLIGETTYGHYQIEMSCGTCHTDAFGGEEVLQNACTQCHAQELEDANDSHPKAKFTDPRNADLLEVVDARYCVSCHTEHHKDKTGEMGLTLPKDYCFHCHEDIVSERDSHKDLEFDSCATSGCHNYHDNRALYEGFLERHADEPLFKAIAQLPARTAETDYKEKYPEAKALTENDVDTASFSHVSDEDQEKIMHDWLSSSHANNGIECQDCHMSKTEKKWVEKPDHTACQSCHEKQVKGFKEGKHGMRLADTLSQPLTAISPKEVTSSLAFKDDALDVMHSCTSCHGPHQSNTQTAAVDACLGCHNDEHSVAYLESPHYQLWQQEVNGELPSNSGVSCASCHMPRQVINKAGKTIVEHNQNLTLRPNEKMIRPVCMNCHGLGFAIDALADKALIKKNFNGMPSEHIPSIDWVKERNKE